MKLLKMLERGEMNSYLSCPAQLLQIILRASLVSRTFGNSATIPQQLNRYGLQLMNEADSFNVRAWATSVQGITSQNDYESRMHVASAHRSAISLYVNRAVSGGSLLDENDVKRLVADIIHHLSFIRAGNHLLKSTSWPAFIAGVETTDTEQQNWVIEHLAALWGMLPWRYIHTAVEMLGIIWQQSRVRSGGIHRSEDWRLRFIRNDWIVV